MKDFKDLLEGLKSALDPRRLKRLALDRGVLGGITVEDERYEGLWVKDRFPSYYGNRSGNTVYTQRDVNRAVKQITNSGKTGVVLHRDDNTVIVLERSISNYYEKGKVTLYVHVYCRATLPKISFDENLLRGILDEISGKGEEVF